MRRAFAGVGLLCAAIASPALGGAMPWRGMGLGGPREPNPAIVALRDCTATLRTNLGDIELALEPDSAPNAVRMFLQLAERGAYDGAPFSCVFKDKMLVAGTPFAKTKGAETLPPEESPISANAGVVLMDRTPDEQNLPGRLLILLSDQNHLDRSYTVFAEVKKGLDVAKRLGSVATRPDDGSPSPIEDVVIEQVVITRKSKPDAKEGTKK